MIGHAGRPNNVCEIVWSLSESADGGLDGGDVESFMSSRGFGVSVSGGFL